MEAWKDFEHVANFSESAGSVQLRKKQCQPAQAAFARRLPAEMEAALQRWGRSESSSLASRIGRLNVFHPPVRKFVHPLKSGDLNANKKQGNLFPFQAGLTRC